MRHICLPIVVVAALSGCAIAPPAPLVQLYKQGASNQDFSRDRYRCLQEAQGRVSGSYVNQYGGASSSNVLPSQGLYYNCMASSGWQRVESGGFIPSVLMEMRP